MNRYSYRIAGGLAPILMALLAGTPAYPFAHLWHVKEVFSNHDGTVQFIELFTSASTETSLNLQQLQANSDGVIKTFTLNANQASPSTNKHLLIATPGFSGLTGGVTPNYTLPDPILNGPFFNPNANSLIIRFVPSNDSLSFSGAALPKDGVKSLTDANAFGLLTNNATNIGVNLNSPTNYAGAIGALTNGDYNGDLTVNAADYTVWRDTLGQTVLPRGSGADGDSDGMIDDGDYDFWKLRFGVVLGGAGSGATGSASASAVPEPVTLVMAALGLLTLALASIRGVRAPA